MASHIFGVTLAALRKKHKMTQIELANALNVTNKAVSKWETGFGFPDIALLPEISHLFGVSIDYLLTGEQTGIAVAGNISADVVKRIDQYPSCTGIANIQSITRSVGGCMPNICINLVTIDRHLPVSAIGCLGEDDYGRYFITELQRHNIDTSRLIVSHTSPTGFSDIMSQPNGDCTAFVSRGANTEFCPEQIDVANLNCRIFHIGYLLLLDCFDLDDPEYGTVMARFLHSVQKRGIETSIDVNYIHSAEYPKKIFAALQYCDYAIIDEIECCGLWGYSPRSEDGALDLASIQKAMQQTIENSVLQRIIVHTPEMAFLMNRDGSFYYVPSLDIPQNEIRTYVGSGDAFCSGALYGIYSKMSDMEILELACAAAVSCLLSDNAVDGCRSKEELWKLSHDYRTQAT